MLKTEKKRAIRNHRMMWCWISFYTEKEKRVILEHEYFDKLKIDEMDVPLANNYLCEYDFEAGGNCSNCPLRFSNSEISYLACMSEDSPYYKWKNAENYKDSARYAKEIARLQEK